MACIQKLGLGKTVGYRALYRMRASRERVSGEGWDGERKHPFTRNKTCEELALALCDESRRWSLLGLRSRAVSMTPMP